MLVTLFDAYTCRLTRPSGERLEPSTNNYMSRAQCDRWLEKNAKAGDIVEVYRTMTTDLVHASVKAPEKTP